MVHKKLSSGFLAVIGYAVAAAALAAALVRTGAPDRWLFLLVGPVILAAAFYPRWVYLAMCLCTLLAAGTVLLIRNPAGGNGLKNLVVAIVLILFNAELLHRMLQARLRAEEELRLLFEREQEARGRALAAQQRFAFLAAASEALAGSLELKATLAEVVRQAVRHLADICVIRLAPGDGGDVELAAAHADPDRERLLEELRDRYELDLGVSGDEAALQSEITDAALVAAARDPGHLRLLRELHPRAAVVVRLAHQEQVVGTMTFAISETDRRYGVEDVELARELARRAVIAIENARLHQALQEADRRKVEFLAMLAHELRNPLAAIANAGYLLEQTARAGTQAERLTGAVTRQAKHLARLVDDLLEASRVTQGKLGLRQEPVEVSAATRHAVEAVRPLVEQRSHRLHVSLPEEDLWIAADPTRYEQILVNLLVNAARYTEEGGRIWLSVSAAAQAVEIRVRDTGVGIAPEVLPRIFELFAQGDPPARGSHGGLGIGLTLVRRLVELHGGSVAARSDGPGRGSEFIVTLPAAAAPASGVPKAPLPGAQSRAVLIVDDDRDAVETLSELLELWGHRVWLARDGALGIDAARAHHLEVALLDIGMPGMDGYEVARRLRAGPDTREMVLVALTGYGAEEDRKRSREAGFDYHLVKPADPEELQRLLTSL